MDADFNRSLHVRLLALAIAPLLLNGWINTFIYTVPALYWSFELLVWVVWPAAIVKFAVRRGGLRGQDVGLSMSIAGRRSLGWILLTALLFSPLALIWYRWSRVTGFVFLPREGLFNYGLVLPRDPGPRALVAVYFALSAAVVEELYFRGWMYRVCRAYARPLLLYLLISPLLFAAIHWENGPANVLATWLVGLLFAAVYTRWRNLWPLMVAHAFIDLVYFS